MLDVKDTPRATVRLTFDGRVIKHRAGDDSRLNIVMTNFIHGGAKGAVSAGAGGANSVDGAADPEDLGNAARMIRIQSQQRQHSVHEIRFFQKLAVLLELIVEIDVMAGDDSGYSGQINGRVRQARIHKRIERHQNRQPRGPRRALDQLPHSLEHVAGNAAFERRDFGIDRSPPTLQ